MAEYKIDRTEWAPGPWDYEPDRIEWRFAGMPCLIVRNTMGNLCGYAAVPPGHRYYGKHYGRCAKWFRRKNLPECWKGYCKHRPEHLLDAHGGITYSDACQKGGAICHEPQPGEADPVWWFGFDCAHMMDVVPQLDATLKKVGLPALGRPHGSYKDMAYVRAGVESLAAQLQAIGNER